MAPYVSEFSGSGATPAAGVQIRDDLLHLMRYRSYLYLEVRNQVQWVDAVPILHFADSVLPGLLGGRRAVGRSRAVGACSRVSGSVLSSQAVALGLTRRGCRGFGCHAIVFSSGRARERLSPEQRIRADRLRR